MRLVSLVCSLFFLAGLGFAQQVALTSAKPDCPPGEPDPIQVSWNKPCEDGDWLLDTETGCRMWDWHPEPEDTVVWQGACRAGKPDGRGEARWFEHGRPIDRFVGTYRDGKREGEGRYDWNATVSFEGNYANDLPQGTGTVRIGDVVMSGEWNKGCLASGGKVVAIGVPRASCEATSKPSARVADR